MIFGEPMTKCLRRLAALLAPVLLAAPAIAQGPAATTMASGGVGLRSEVAALRIVAAQRLPRSPVGERPDFCRHLFATARTPAGGQVIAAGWAVTREAAFGPYQAVSFVRGAEPGTSGTCRMLDGNVAIFRGTDLVAIVYAPGGGDAIGSVSAFGGDALRIWSGDFLGQPVADLQVGADGGIAVRPLAAEERVCGGRAVVPNVYGRPINEARAILQRSGWTPVPPQARDGNDSRVSDLVRRGVPEVEDCSGTGFGFCAYSYGGAAGTLSVTTVGDNDFPAVAGYSVRCRLG
ncbi:hypothetical protein [Neoroseomonas oryzicola]|uniref:Uncharacterized protein n=2 Tax=Neoroseomonas oryzicola TaxID=535904 RepID=A0A9X9WPC9_9PROT|nr:hypothetical protein [Neoroseomonas oryzicola]MBR0662189.1 hypothetical protein [Neoroseomonas oryzicola]